MKLFSIDWFRSEKSKELEALKVEGQKLQNKILESTLNPPLTPSTKPYKKRKLVDKQLTVILHDGSILSKSNATIQDYEAVGNATDVTQILRITSSVDQEGRKAMEKEKTEVEKIKKTVEAFESLKGLEDFEVVYNTVYLKGIKRTLPALLVEKFAEIVNRNIFSEEKQDPEYKALKKFWLKCCLNPSAKSAEDLYKFLNRHQFKIDKHGNFYAYRRVQNVGGDKDLIKFISDTYSKVKAVWKKKASDYFVYLSDGSYCFSKETHTGDLGNLEKLYLDLPNMKENRYTSAHTGKEDYRVGEVISMPRNDGDDNNQISCSKGFHAASKAYDYSSFGDTPILVIINPMDVLAVPLNEDGKLRTCRWFFASTLTNAEQHILDNEDFDVSDLGDVFEEKCAENLEEYIKKGFAEEIKRHTFDLAPINHVEVIKIVKSLDEMRESISKRINLV